MIDVPTVFILGAGASIPYGYPSGEDLRTKIIDNLLQNRSKVQEIVDLGYYEGDVKQFARDLAGSQTYTIDEFIEPRKEFLEIGKCAIAQALIPCEIKKEIFQENNPEHWYRMLYRRLRAPDFNDFTENKVSIITFNYDRSLEEFLFNTLQRHYGKNEFECADKLKKISIIHVYGKLDDLNWQNPYGRAYDNNLCSGEYLRSAARGIRTMHEIDESTVNEIETKLARAEEIYFLGFGYDKTNLQRLNIINLIKGRDALGNVTINRTVRGTAFKLGTYHKNSTSNYFLGQIELGAENEDCVKFLGKYGF